MKVLNQAQIKQLEKATLTQEAKQFIAQFPKLKADTFEKCSTGVNNATEKAEITSAIARLKALVEKK